MYGQFAENLEHIMLKYAVWDNYFKEKLKKELWNELATYHEC